MPSNRFSQYQRGVQPENLLLNTFKQMCFGAAGVLVLMQLNAGNGVRSAVAAILPQKVMVPATTSSSQNLNGAVSSYFNQSEAVLRKCPWFADKFTSQPDS
ncbi:MAG: hypothetical protein QNJ46_03875 [Leptolyngbyaceae cyanobacterium MO_188.B28]|nr:hypothetical protein [Leptolyngbyaceae cyanobacterium MO_188.B28]